MLLGMFSRKICINYIFLETTDLQLQNEIFFFSVSVIRLKFDTKEASSMYKTGFQRPLLPPPPIKSL